MKRERDEAVSELLCEALVNSVDGRMRDPRRIWRSLERPLGLDRETDGYFGRSVENLKDVIAEQTPVLALGPLAGCQFNSAVSGVALRTGNIAFFHTANMHRDRPVFQPRSLPQSGCRTPPNRARAKSDLRPAKSSGPAPKS